MIDKQGNAAPAAQTDSSSFEMGILAFGTSVTVTDEVRRSVEKEAEVIEESIKQLRGKIKLEEKVGEELRRSRVSGLKETREILQGSTENLNSLQFTVDFLQELHKSFTIELMDPATRPSGEGEGGNDTTKNLLPPEYGISTVDIKAEIAEHQRELDALHEQGIAHVHSLSALKEKKRAVAEAIETVKRRIQEDKLEEQNAELDKKILLAKQEHETEVNRRSSLLASLEEAKKQSDALDHEKRTLLAELDEKTDSLQNEEEDREKLKSMMEKEKSDKQDVLQRLKSGTSSNALRTSELKAHLEEARKLVALQEELKAKREAARAERLELLATKQTLEIELASAKELAAETTAEALIVEESLLEVDTLRQQNDDKQEKLVLPGEREYESLLQQETELKSLIEDAKNDPSLLDLKVSIDDLQQQLEDVQKECSVCSAELTKKKTEKEERDAQAENHKHSTSAESDALREEISAAEKENADFEKSISRLDRKIQEKSGGKELAMLKQKLRIFQSGADLLKATAKKEKDILNIDSKRSD